jgi:cob(I)alamin adenosyltransferase
MKIYTHKGDDGFTSLSGNKRVRKTSKRIEAIGSVDELIAWIGLLGDFKENESRKEILLYIEDQLMRCASSLAAEGESTGISDYQPDNESIRLLERAIDNLQSGLPPQKGFILPGGHIIISYCHIARCVCRRVERRVLSLMESEDLNPVVPKLLNRLSDYLYILSRYIALELDIQEIKWPF